MTSTSASVERKGRGFGDHARCWAIAGLSAVCMAACARAPVATSTQPNWSEPRGLPASGLLLDVVFLDETHLVAVGGTLEHEPGTIVTSDDGGSTWSVRTHPSPARLYSVAAVGNGAAVAVGLDSTILRSADRGATWELVHSGDGWLAGVAFANATDGLAVGHVDEHAHVLATSDGGFTWHPGPDVPAACADATWRAVAFEDTLHGRVVGTGGWVLTTSDGGRSFDALQTGDDYLRAIAFDGAATWLAADRGVVLRSNGDGFDRTESFPGERLNDLVFVDASLGFASSMSGALHVTRDGGSTWEPAAQNAGAALSGIAVERASGRIVVVGEAGRGLLGDVAAWRR